MDVYIESPLTNEFKQSLECLIQSNNDVETIEHHKWKPRRFMGFILDIILRDIINGKKSSLIKEIEDTLSEDYQYLRTLAEDMREQINDTFTMGCGVEIAFTVTELSFMGTLIKLKIEVSDEL